MYHICFYFFMFYCYSIMGWLVECLSCSLYNHKFVHDRGFLIGPYCPIYGCGAMYMYFFLNRYYHDPIVLFIMAFVGTSLIEYVTSYIMEKLFKVRWWDYSERRFNVEGRICLLNSFSFGVLGMLFIYVLNPGFTFLVSKIPHIVLMIISLILFISFLADIILSFSIMTKLKINLSNIRKDSTSDIDKEVKNILSKHTFYLHKLFNSFPKVKFSFPRGEQILVSAKKNFNNFDHLRKERKQHVKKLKQEIHPISKKSE